MAHGNCIVHLISTLSIGISKMADNGGSFLNYSGALMNDEQRGYLKEIWPNFNRDKTSKIKDQNAPNEF